MGDRLQPPKRRPEGWFAAAHGVVFALAFAAVAMVPGPAWPDARKAVAIELNKLEPNGAACRAYLVLKNGTESVFGSLKVFDIADQPCGGIGRVLLNDVLACRDAAGPREDCLDLVVPSARGPIPFIE